MTPTEITDAARLIRPYLTRELALCRAVNPSDAADQMDRIQRAIEAFDQLVEMAQIAALERAQTEHIGLAVSVEETTA